MTSELTNEQRKAIAICMNSHHVSVSEVQRKLNISYSHAQELCQSIVNTGLFDDVSIAPSLKRVAKHPEITDAEIMSLAYDCNALPEVMTDATLIVFARAFEAKLKVLK